MVLQDTHLFTGTVMENIRYGKLDATDEEVDAAARLANADSFIQQASGWLQHMCWPADGSKLEPGTAAASCYRPCRALLILRS